MSKQVTVYTTPTCGYCHQVKRFLGERGIQFNEVDVANDEAAAIEIVERTGQLRVPVIEVDGSLVVGFDQPRLEQLLQDG